MVSLKKTGMLFCSILLAVLMAFSLAGCKKEGPAERAGKKIDKAVEKTGDKLEDASDKAADKMEEAGDKAKEATDK